MSKQGWFYDYEVIGLHMKNKFVLELTTFVTFFGNFFNDELIFRKLQNFKHQVRFHWYYNSTWK